MTKPIFTGEYVAFGPFDQAALRLLVQRIARPGVRCVEVGSWLGNGSTQVFIEVLKDQPQTSLVCVDTWAGSPNVPRHQALIAEYDAFATFRHNVDAAGGARLVQALRTTSIEAASRFPDSHFDLVDAEHSYEAVQADVAAWRPKVRPGGILCGHDCETRVTPANLPLLLANLQYDAFSVDGAKTAAIHAGSCLAVHEAFDGRANLFTDHLLELPDGRAGYATLWWIEAPASA